MDLDLLLRNKNRILLKKIRSKKSSGKASDIFSCLTIVPEIKAEKPKIVEIDTKFARIGRRMKALKNWLLLGKPLKIRHTRRYIRWAEKLGEEVPQWVIDLNKEQEGKSYVSKKKTKVKKEVRKRKPKKYDAYINSGLWERRKNAYYKLYGRMCAICGSIEFIHLHHKYYGEYGEEKDNHLIPLCKSHHDEFHAMLGKTKKNMIKETDFFIQDKKLSLLK